YIKLQFYQKIKSIKSFTPLTLHDAHPIYRNDYRLSDALVCARLGISVQEPHPRRPQNACQYLLDPAEAHERLPYAEAALNAAWVDRKSTRLNSSHVKISYAVLCLQKKK